MKSLTSFLCTGVYCGLAVILAHTTTATAADYQLTDLGSLGGGQAVARDLNDNGQVVGWSLLPGETFPHAFLWENGSMTPLGILTGDEQSVARAINNNGMIIGTSERDVTFGYGVFHAVQFTGGSPVELTNLGGTWSMAHDVTTSDRSPGSEPTPMTGKLRSSGRVMV